MKASIRKYALDLGFSACGFAKARTLDELQEFYNDFIDSGRNAGMDYLARYESQRINPAKLLPGVKSVVAVLINYYPPFLVPEEDNFILSKYAAGKRYPQFISKKLEPLARFLSSQGTDIQSRIYVDSGPVLEKRWAMLCGIGWQGKHTILVNPRLGSFLYVGIILTTLDIEPDLPGQDHCGNCRKCMDACPTGAIEQPYRLNIRKCISYCTTVKKAEMSEEVRQNLQGRIFGCDICQDVCPFNRFSVPTKETHFHPPEELLNMRRKDWLNLSREKFDELFAGTSVGEKGYERLMGNMALIRS